MAVLTTMKMVWSVKTLDLKMKLHTLSKHAKTMKIDLLKWKPKYRLVKKNIENYLTVWTVNDVPGSFLGFFNLFLEVSQI